MAAVMAILVPHFVIEVKVLVRCVLAGLITARFVFTIVIVFLAVSVVVVLFITVMVIFEVVLIFFIVVPVIVRHGIGVLTSLLGGHAEGLPRVGLHEADGRVLVAQHIVIGLILGAVLRSSVLWLGFDCV